MWHLPEVAAALARVPRPDARLRRVVARMAFAVAAAVLTGGAILTWRLGAAANLLALASMRGAGRLRGWAYETHRRAGAA